MKKSIFRLLSLFLVLTTVVALAACGSKEPVACPESEATTAPTAPPETTTETSAETTTEATTSEVEPNRFVTDTSETAAETTAHTEPAGPVNYLTGVALAQDADPLYRPTAVSVNNLKIAAKFQSGLSLADIIYEVEVEGGITRLLAVFSDPTLVGTLGSVRSARPVMNCIVLGHDAYFVHSGGSKQAYSELATYGIPDIDGMKKYAGYFYYDDAVVAASSLEHGYFTTGEKVGAALERFISSGGRSQVNEGYNNIFLFYEEPTAPENGLPAAVVTTSYGGYKPQFIYDAESGAYAREQYGAPHVDYATGEQLYFENVIVLSVESSVIPGDSAGRRDFDDVGSGVGILATRGTYINIKWEKESYTSPIVLTTEDGSPLTVNVGKTFISYVNGEKNISVSAE